MKDFGTAAILCGGESRRMGFDKCKIKVNGKFLVEIIAEQLESIFEEVILISNDSKKLNPIKYKIVEDIIPNSGPMGGIYTALSKASSNYVFITACDMPVISIDYIKYMMKVIEKKKVEGVVSYNSGFMEPMHSFYSKYMTSAFENELKMNNFRLQDAIKCSNVFFVEEGKVREYSKGMDIFVNLNYKSDIRFLNNIFTGENGYEYLKTNISE